MDEKMAGASAETVEELAKKPPEELAEQLKTESEKDGGRRGDMLKHFGVTDVEFVKPIEYCGKTYERAHLDFNRLTGKDIEALEEELGGDIPTWPANSRKYQKLLAAKASKIPSDVIAHLSAADYNAVTTAARNFLLASAYS